MGRPKKVVENEETTKINKRGPYKKRKKAEIAISTTALIPIPKATKNINGVRKKAINIGDIEHKKYVDTGESGHAVIALAGYKEALNATKLQLTYMKITGRGKKITFCEE
jgi:predicted alternative tryptophan synthase beta-subunit